ncbi:MAG: hypothetical protein ACLTMP_13390 [Eggerthella lenta]
MATLRKWRRWPWRHDAIKGRGRGGACARSSASCGSIACCQLTPEKATSLLEDSGPTFVKMGQIAANRSDVIPPAYADAFKRLRACVRPCRSPRCSPPSRNR